ncbi:MAG: GNAT family N-acetyltransferase [Actinomycetota bacterium]|nr:GNAT family N-acetyltransferase [Actinomycetota bacterium]
MDLRIRPGRGEDAPAVAAVFSEAARAGWSRLFPPAWFDALDAAPERFRRDLEGFEWAEVLVAEEDDEILGFATVRPSADGDADETVGELHMLYVRPAVWGRGVGRALLAEAVAAIARRGFGEATLWTEARNARPRRVYEAAGWRLDGPRRVRAFGGATVVDVRYRIALARDWQERRP